MDSINSWINEDEVRKLAEDLSASPEAVKEWKDENFDGFAIPEKQGQGEKLKSGEADEKKADAEQEMKDSKSSSLAGASALAASAGLLGAAKPVIEIAVPETVKEVKPVIEPVIKVVEQPKIHSHFVSEIGEPTVKLDEALEAILPPLCDHCLNEVPVNVDERARTVFPTIKTEKELGTFEQIDTQLTKTVKANGICVIDRDGDVLYSSMKNQSLVSFTIDSMMEAKLMRTRDGEFGNIRLKISAAEYLEFISVHSTRGVLVLAISMDHILGNKNAQYVAGDVLKIANLV